MSSEMQRYIISLVLYTLSLCAVSGWNFSLGLGLGLEQPGLSLSLEVLVLHHSCLCDLPNPKLANTSL